MTRKGKKNLPAFIPALLIMIIIFIFSAQPSDESDDISQFVGYKIFSAANTVFDLGWGVNKIAAMSEDAQHTIRKAAHMTEYMFLAIAVYAAFGANYDFNRKSVLPALTLLISAAYAASDEIHQLMVPGRSGMISDVGIDTLGAAAGVALMLLISSLKRKTGNVDLKTDREEA